MQTFIINNLAPLADSVEVIIYEERRDERDAIKVKVWKNPDGSVTIETEQVQENGSFSVGVTTKTVTLGKEGYRSQTSKPQAEGRGLDAWRTDGDKTKARLNSCLRDGSNTPEQATLLHEAEYAYVGGKFEECNTLLDKRSASKESRDV